MSVWNEENFVWLWVSNKKVFYGYPYKVIHLHFSFLPAKMSLFGGVERVKSLPQLENGKVKYETVLGAICFDSLWQDTDIVVSEMRERLLSLSMKRIFTQQVSENIDF